MAKNAQRYVNRLGLHLQRAGQRIRRSGYSNFDEERILARLVRELLREEDSRFAVDIGAGDGVRGSNTYALFRRGWRGLGVEGDERRARRLERAYRNFVEVEALHALVAPQNVIALLREHGVPHDFVVRYDPDFSLRHHFFGYSIASLEELCARHDYALLALEYNNAFIAPRELVGAARSLDATEAYRRGYLQRRDRRERFPANQDMEPLHSMPPADALAFLRKFFARHEGKYELSVKE